MATRGALIIRIAGDVRDLGKATAKASKQLEGVAKGAGLAGAAAGAALAAGVVGAVNVEKANDKLAAGLGLSKKRSAEIGKVAGNLYKNAYGDSIEGVNDAVGAVMSSIDGMSKASGKRLESVTAKALNFASAFEVDVTRASQVAGQVMRTGLAKNATEAFDLLTTASQNVPKALREDVLDAADEYGQFFAGIGMNGKQTFAALVKGAEKGQFGIDKIGDAVKEFTIRSTDMSSASKDAYEAIGLDAGKMANKMVKGGKTAGKATQDIVKGLLDMKPGAKQANAAIALFGTPLEDLSVQEIPEFLKQLQGGSKAMDGFRGSTKRMGKTLNDNASTNLESFKRQVVSTFVEFVGGKALPIVNEVAKSLAKNFGPALKSAAEWMGKNRDVLIPVAAALGTMVGIIGAVVAAQKTWIIVQGVLNTVMALNPIGLVIIAIAGLVAGLVVAYKKSETFRKIVDGAWRGVKSAIKGVADWWTKTAWPAIRGALSAMGDWFKMVGRVAKRSWRGMADGIGATWRWIKKQVIDRFVFGLKVWALIFKASAARVRAIWSSVGAALGRVGSWIQRRVFSPLVDFVTKRIPNGFRNARDRVAGAFGSMRDRLERIGSWIRKNVFGRMRDALNVMKNAFRNAKDGIGRIWDDLKAKASKPVKFMIHTVWNNGLRKMLNAIPGVDINPVKIGFRSGGAVRGPGTGTSDSITARLSKGEHVWTAKEVAAAGGQKAMYAMRDAVLKGNLNGDPKFANGGALDGDAISKAQAFARQQFGKPYGWGAVGPSSYDCSGFMSALTNVLRGRSPYSRVGSTANFPWSGFEKGPGQFTIGSTPNYARSGVGHMAGNLAGMGVESRGGRGVLLGTAAMSPASAGFQGMYHLGAKGKLGDASGGWLDHVSNVLSAMRKLPGQIQEVMSGGSWIAPFMKKMVTGMWPKIADYLNKKIPDLGPIKTNPIPRGIPTFDNGGTLSPGYNTVYNGLGRPEPLRRADEPARVVLEINSGGNDVDDMLVKILRRAVKVRGGNVQLVIGRG